MLPCYLSRHGGVPLFQLAHVSNYVNKAFFNYQIITQKVNLMDFSQLF